MTDLSCLAGSWPRSPSSRLRLQASERRGKQWGRLAQPWRDGYMVWHPRVPWEDSGLGVALLNRLCCASSAFCFQGGEAERAADRLWGAEGWVDLWIGSNSKGLITVTERLGVRVSPGGGRWLSTLVPIGVGYFDFPLPLDPLGCCGCFCLSRRPCTRCQKMPRNTKALKSRQSKPKQRRRPSQPQASVGVRIEWAALDLRIAA